MRAFQAAGVTIPRVAADQWRHGPHIPDGQEQPGDLAFFRLEQDGPGHVGIIIGNGQMIHAPNSREVVKITPYARADLVGFTRPIASEIARGATVFPDTWSRRRQGVGARDAATTAMDHQVRGRKRGSSW